MDKTCETCAISKPLTDFARLRREDRRTPVEQLNADAFRSSCRMCVDQQANRAEYLANRSRVRAQVDQWRKDNPEARKAAARRHARKVRWAKFGVTPEQAEALLVRADGRCESCDEDLSDAIGITVDHDHDTNEVRGVLCAPCNKAEGFLRSDPVRVRKLADYLERHGR